MQYNFDLPVQRRGTNSLKWDVQERELPMWVADMDFQTAPEIRMALQKKVEHGVFGYSIISEQWYEAYINWWKEKHHFQMEKEWLIFCTGVVPAISSAVRRFTAIGENILIQTPVYPIFFNSIINNGRHVLENPLKYNGKEYSIDFQDLERKLADPQTTMMILCNPHNPIGKVWDKETLERIGELCYKYHVIVIADEIHCDLTYPGYEYIPFSSVSEICRRMSVTCIAPTKTFNLAGIQTAAVVISDEVLRNKMIRALNTDEVAEPNTFAADAAIAAFQYGETWLNKLKNYIFENKQAVNCFLKKDIPQIKVIDAQATYLLWLDCRKLPGSSSELSRFLREKTGLYLSDGEQYGEAGKGFLRMNIACPKKYLLDGLGRLKKGVFEYEKWMNSLC